MAKLPRVLITGGPVYGPLDDNKLVGNRVRGIWASEFAEHLAEAGHEVTLLLPDLMKPSHDDVPYHFRVTPLYHSGYWDYAKKCESCAPKHDAAIMAAAVVNWIPASPVKGKMVTAGFKEGDIINIPFVLAPRIINRMREWNPDITLIGCKMLIGSTEPELVEAAYHVLLTAKCNVVVANDMAHGLRRKQVVHQDRTVLSFDNDFRGFFQTLEAIINDEHFHTVRMDADTSTHLVDRRWCGSVDLFDRIIEKYRSRFSLRQADSDRVFGGLLVPTGKEGYFLSPREKGTMFSSADAAWVPHISHQTFGDPIEYGLDGEIRVARGPKATLNAPLLIRMWEKWQEHPRAIAVLHLHEELQGVPTLAYMPPGTTRDNFRFLPETPTFNIKGHGFIACVDADGEIVK